MITDVSDRPNMILADEVAHFLAECERVATLPCSAENAPKFRALQADEVKLRGKLKDAHKVEKAPHLEACRVVDGKYFPQIDTVSEAIKAVTKALTQFLEAEEKRIEAEKAEARRLAAEAESRATALAAAAEIEEDPFEAFDKIEEARAVEASAASLTRQAALAKATVANAEGGRGGGLRTVGYLVTVEDAAVLVAHYAHRSEFLDLAISMAKADAKAAKGQVTIPGAKIAANRRAA